MHLMYYRKNGKRVYTLKKKDPWGRATMSAHPARFSPDDKYAGFRVTLYKRFKMLPGQDFYGCKNLAEYKERARELKALDENALGAS